MFICCLAAISLVCPSESNLIRFDPLTFKFDLAVVVAAAAASAAWSGATFLLICQEHVRHTLNSLSPAWERKRDGTEYPST